MKKSELIAALGSIHDDELVMLKIGDEMFSIQEVEIQQEEPPLFGVVATNNLSADEFQKIAGERQAARDAEAERVRKVEEAEAEKQAKFDQEEAERKAKLEAEAKAREEEFAKQDAERVAKAQANLDAHIQERVAAEVAKVLAEKEI